MEERTLSPPFLLVLSKNNLLASVLLLSISIHSPLLTTFIARDSMKFD